MADTKISALTAAAAAALANELPINEAGTSKKLTVQQILDATGILASAGALADADEVPVAQSNVAKNVALSTLRAFMLPAYTASGAAPATGAAHQGAAPSTTIVLNTANNAVTTVETVLNITSVLAGTYFFEYYIVWRSGTTTVGTSFAVDYSGTVTRVRATRYMQTTGTTAATGVSDGTSAILTGSLVEHASVVTDNGALGPNTGVGSTSEDQYDVIRGTIVVSDGGTLSLTMTGEGNAAVTFSADSFVRLTRLA